MPKRARRYFLLKSEPEVYSIDGVTAVTPGGQRKTMLPYYGMHHGLTYDDFSPLYGTQTGAVDMLSDGSASAAFLGGDLSISVAAGEQVTIEEDFAGAAGETTRHTATPRQRTEPAA